MIKKVFIEDAIWMTGRHNHANTLIDKVKQQALRSWSGSLILTKPDIQNIGN